MNRIKNDAGKLAEGVIKAGLEGFGSIDNSAVGYIEKLSQKRGANTAEERFKVTPDYAYPNTRMNRMELREEVNKKSTFYHTLGSSENAVGQVSLEILQCFGLPKTEVIGEAAAFCIAVCGSSAFKTDVMPRVANPMWLCKMRRACIFNIHEAYARLYVGVFDCTPEGKKDIFAGRIVVDVCRLRPNCTYDVTLPLRQSAQAYCRQQRGAIRFRMHLHWHSERQALLSYLKPPSLAPNDSVTVQCCDAKSFQNVARVVHGDHMPGRFTTKQLNATVREINFTRIHVLRYLRKRELRNLIQWRNPLISAFVFGAWMHCSYTASVSYVPGHLITFLLLYLWKNYAYYGLDSPVQNGFVAPTWEEMFMALVSGNNHSIEPLEMKTIDGGNAKSAIEDMAEAAEESPAAAETAPDLKEIAKAFRQNVKVQTLRYRVQVYHNVFRGSDAVNYLVTAGHASSTEDAVLLGRRLAKELKLFEHVLRKYEFNDANLFYVFLAYNCNEYVIRTHQPWGKGLFRVLCFLPENELTKAESQLEMPYSDGVDHPRFTVKESLVIRSKESKKMLLQEKLEQLEDDLLGGKTESQQLEDGLDKILENPSEDSTDSAPPVDEKKEQDASDETADIEITMLKKPPQQDVDVKNAKGRMITDVLAEARHKVHGILLHVFNDRTYTIDVAAQRQISRRHQSRTGPPSPSRRFRGTQDREKDLVVSEKEGSPEAVQDEYDKLLGTGIHSSGKPWVSKIGVIVQPIVEIALEWLCLFRALFNVFTWRDPILSFWVSILGPVAVIVLHLFPWRIVLGIAGLALFGPQNWMLRMYREQKNGYEEFDPDKLVKKKKKPTVEPEALPLFSMYTHENRPVTDAAIDASTVRKVAVPYSQLMYQRFYNWPPETEYARVTAEDPPRATMLVDSSERSSGIDVTSVSSDDTTKTKRSWTRVSPLAIIGTVKRRSGLRRRNQTSPRS